MTTVDIVTIILLVITLAASVAGLLLKDIRLHAVNLATSLILIFLFMLATHPHR